MALKNKCREYCGEKKDCPVTQKGKTFRLMNEKGLTVSIFNVDPCLIPDPNQQKCDYLFLVEDKQKPKYAYFIELKGTELSEAIKQLTNSIDILHPNISGYKVFGRIVCKKVIPQIKRPRAKLDEKLKGLGGNLVIASRAEYIEPLNN